MAEKTIRGLAGTSSVVSNQVFPTAPTSGPDTKTSVSQLNTYFNTHIQLADTSQVTGLNTALARKADLIGDNTFEGIQTFDGKIIANSNIEIDDAGNVSTEASMSMSTLNVSDVANLPIVNPNESYVSTSGNDTTGDGSITNPYLTVEHADSIAVDAVIIQSGEFKESAISTKLAAWVGAGKEITQVNSGLITLNDTTWQAATSPYKLIQNLLIVSSAGSGEVLEVNLTNAGSGYSSAPTVGFTGGGGSGAAATAIVGFAIASVSVTNPGSYTSIPTISATLGSGATFATSMTALTATVIAGGTGYTPGLKLLAVGGIATGNVYAILNVDTTDSDGSITGLSVDAGGVYTTLPTNPLSAPNLYSSCLVATTLPLTATYSDGDIPLDPGVGATLENSGIIAPLYIDGVFPTIGDRILVWTMSNTRFNGIYVVTFDGAEGEPWLLTRATDCDTPIEISKYGRVQITSGDTYASTQFEVSSNRPVQIGTGGSPINFTPTAGTGVQFDLTTYGIYEIEVTSGGNDYEVGSTLNISGSGGGAGTITLASTGHIKRVNLTSGGSNYSSAPTVGFTGGAGTGAAATAIVSPLTGSMSFEPIALKSNSSYIFHSASLPIQTTLSLASSLIFYQRSEADNLSIVDITDSQLNDSTIGGAEGLIIRSVNATAVDEMNINIQNCKIERIQIFIASENEVAINLKLQNVDGLTSIEINDSGQIIPVSISCDQVSYPTGGITSDSTYNFEFLEPINTTPKVLNVSIDGLSYETQDFGDGSLLNPYKTFSKAVTDFTSGDSINVTPGSYMEGTVSLKPNMFINGQSPFNTFISFDTVNITGWTSGSPYLNISNIKFEGAFALIANSYRGQIILNNVEAINSLYISNFPTVILNQYKTDNELIENAGSIVSTNSTFSDNLDLNYQDGIGSETPIAVFNGDKFDQILSILSNSSSKVIDITLMNLITKPSAINVYAQDGETPTVILRMDERSYVTPTVSEGSPNIQIIPIGMSPQIKTITDASHPLTTSDLNSTLRMNSASAMTIVLPKDATEDLPLGRVCQVAHTNTGDLDFAPEDGTVTLITLNDALISAGKGACFAIDKLASNTFIVCGAFAS